MPGKGKKRDKDIRRKAKASSGGGGGDNGIIDNRALSRIEKRAVARDRFHLSPLAHRKITNNNSVRKPVLVFQHYRSFGPYISRQNWY